MGYPVEAKCLLRAPPAVKQRNSEFSPRCLLMYFLRLLQQTTFLPPPPKTIKWLVFLTETDYVYCEVGTNSYSRLLLEKLIFPVVSFLLGKSLASVYYCMPTFRNSLSVPSSKAMVEYFLTQSRNLRILWYCTS